MLFSLEAFPKVGPSLNGEMHRMLLKALGKARSGPKVQYSPWHLLVPCVEMCPAQETWSLSSEPKVNEQPKSSREKRLGELPGAVNFRSGVWLILNSSWEAN